MNKKQYVIRFGTGDKLWILNIEAESYSLGAKGVSFTNNSETVGFFVYENIIGFNEISSELEDKK